MADTIYDILYNVLCYTIYYAILYHTLHLHPAKVTKLWDEGNPYRLKLVQDGAGKGKGKRKPMQVWAPMDDNRFIRAPFDEQAHQGKGKSKGEGKGKGDGKGDGKGEDKGKGKVKGKGKGKGKKGWTPVQPAAA